MKNDGGPAFPCGAVYDPSRETIERMDAYVDLGGMTLRDWFAGQALAMEWTGRGFSDVGQDTAKRVSEACFEIADAMLEARE